MVEEQQHTPPAGYTVHRESTTEILVAAKDSANSRSQVFINPIQEFNRDLSVLALRAWSNLLAAEKRQTNSKRRAGKQERANKKRKRDQDAELSTPLDTSEESAQVGLWYRWDRRWGRSSLLIIYCPTADYLDKLAAGRIVPLHAI